MRVEKLFLYKKGLNNALERTTFFLSGTISRVEDKFYCEFRANFGARPPEQAKILMVEKGAIRATPLIRNGQILEHAPVSFAPSPGTEKITLIVITQGSAVIPGKLYVEIRNTEEQITNGDMDHSPTIPLGISITSCQPQLENEQTLELSRSLRASSNPHLQTLGEIIEAKALDEKMIYLDRLVNRGADLRIVEAAAKFIGLYHPMMGLESLDLNDPVAAFLAVFHQQTPAHLLEADFTNALKKACTIQVPIWRSIAKSALLALLQTERGMLALPELVNTYNLCGEELIGILLGNMKSWGEKQLKKPTIDLIPPAENCLEVISRRSEKDALHATIGYLRYYGFIRITDLLD